MNQFYFHNGRVDLDNFRKIHSQEKGRNIISMIFLIDGFRF